MSKEQQETKENLKEIGILLDNLKSTNLTKRIYSVSSLTRISSVLGPLRTRNELIPFINESTDDDDEVLLEMAIQLGKLIDYIGDLEHIYILLTPLELLSTVEESQVRNEAVKSISLIVKEMTYSQIIDYFIPFLRRLSMHDWFTSRTSSCSLYPVLYQKLRNINNTNTSTSSSKTNNNNNNNNSKENNNDILMNDENLMKIKNELKETFISLCKDDTPTVRRAAALNYGALCNEMDINDIINDMIPLLKDISEDVQDSVRLLTITCCVNLLNILTIENKLTYILPIIMKCSTDKSWRVRWSVANLYDDICLGYNKDIINNQLIISLESLLTDTEAEVKTTICSKLYKISQYININNFIHKIIPAFKTLVTDPSEHVRASLANNITWVTPIIGRDHTVQHLIPLLLQLLRDNSAEVRLNVISQLKILNDVVGIELLSQSLLPAITELAEDQTWRIRLSIIEQIPHLGEQLGVDFFNDKLLNYTIKLLDDTIFSVRKKTTETIKSLVHIFGTDWAKTNILPCINTLATSNSFNSRMTSIFIITSLVTTLDPSTYEQDFFPSLIELSHDTVPNIRFTIANSFDLIYNDIQNNSIACSKELMETMNTTLNELSNDDDDDVKYFALRTLHNIEQSK